MKSKTTITTETWQTTLVTRIELESDQEELIPIPPKARPGPAITGPHLDADDAAMQKELEILKERREK